MTFRIECVPVAQPRQRVAVIAGAARNYTPHAHPVNLYKLAVAAAFRAAGGECLDGPVHVAISCVFPRPKSTPKKQTGRVWHVSKPDCDNLAKSTLDCLCGLAFHDDRQVCVLKVCKEKAAVDESPHVVVTIQEVD